MNSTYFRKPAVQSELRHKLQSPQYNISGLFSAEPPKKKSSKQRFKDINKKETGGDLMDAYTDKPPPQEVYCKLT